MRFTLEGQPAPIIATPTSIINIPKKTAYSVEVIAGLRSADTMETWQAAADPRP